VIHRTLLQPAQRIFAILHTRRNRSSIAPIFFVCPPVLVFLSW
jgi:hypothetical protein